MYNFFIDIFLFISNNNYIKKIIFKKYLMNNENFVYLAIGTNLGDKKQNILTAIKKLQEHNIQTIEISPLYETPALMLTNSPSDWNIPYYDCVIKVDTNIEPLQLLDICKIIEKEMGRDFSARWSPRPIDIDIIFYKNQHINTEKLTIPHKEFIKRSFVLDPLSFIYPEKTNNYYTNQHQPIFMGILNITPDSFSDGGKYNNEDDFINTFETWVENNVLIIDIGAESTKPKATPLTAEEELERLQFVFKYIKNKKFDLIRPLLSIDTYHPKTAEQAILNGFNIVNDISGMCSQDMIDLAKNNPQIKFVFMHNLGIPNDKKIVIPDNKNVIEEIDKWLENKINVFEKNNLKKEQLILDLGIGFGKTPSQNLQILQNIEHFHKYGFKILIGHSRKSFMKVFSNASALERDVETLAISMKIANKVDILRVHTPLEHKRALLAVDHVNNQFV